MNTDQLELDLELAPIIPATSGLTIDEAFDEFHANNPHVYRNLRFLAFQALRAGRKRIGMKFLYERLRWEYFIKTKHGDDEFALNNNFSSRYARLIMREEAELDGFFEVRLLRPERIETRKACV